MTQETNTYALIGIDIGGSHITAAVVDLGSGSMQENTLVRKHINSSGPAEEILEGWMEVITAVKKRCSCTFIKVGIAMPGPFDYRNGVSLIHNMNKYESLYGLNIRQLLSEKLAISESDISFRNDAESFLAGEALGGAGKGYDKLFGITLGTGLGSAVYCNGVSHDLNLGSSPFRDGIAEDYLSTRWFLKAYFELTGLHLENVKALAELVEKDESARLVMEAFIQNLSLFLMDYIKKENPDAVIIGGNISKASPRFLPGVRKVLLENCMVTPIKVAVLGETAALIGAFNLLASESSL